MQESSIQFQHFWIDLLLGLIMIYILIETPLEQALVGIAVVASFVFFSRAIQRSRRASLRRAEARLRKEEADLTLQWIERARKVEPLGQVIIANAQQRDMMLLENGDVIRIPRKDDLVLVSGEVLFPNAVAFQQGMSVDDYISRAGGYLQKASNARVVVAKRDGSYQQKGQSGFNSTINAGDQILVLPKVDDKKRQFWKELTQILYQIAVGAKIVFDL